MKMILVALAAIGMMACNHEVLRPVANTETQVTAKDEAVDLTVEWLKNKNNSLDALMWLNNRTTKTVFTTQASYKLEFNGGTYVPRANQGLIEIQPGQRAKVILIFEMPAQRERTGKVVLVVDPLYQGTVEGTTRTKLSPMKVNFDLTGNPVH